MTNHFHKSCYTSRSSGYKYRTLATNTGDRKRRDSYEEGCVDRAFRDMRRAILSRLDTEFDKTAQSRNLILSKFEKIDAKINSMLELQDSLVSMRQKLTAAEASLANMFLTVKKIEDFTVPSRLSVPHSLKSKKSTFRAKEVPLSETEEKELFSSEIVT